jgi:hypothetical protein
MGLCCFEAKARAIWQCCSSLSYYKNQLASCFCSSSSSLVYLDAKLASLLSSCDYTSVVWPIGIVWSKQKRW